MQAITLLRVSNFLQSVVTCLCTVVITIAVSACRPAPKSANGTFVFGDEFDTHALDSAKWVTCPKAGWCTDPALLSVYRPDNVSLSRGLLQLTARKEQADGYGYTSGAISSHKSFTFTYGYMEIRAKVPAGRGLWPAFWARRPNDEWPPEIDVLEFLGHEPHQLHMNIHFFDPFKARNHGTEGTTWQSSDFTQNFHVYAVDWRPGEVIWYVDGVERYRNKHAPNKPMHVIANLAVGAPGSWPGAPDAATTFPSVFEIDYIRVYQGKAHQ